MQMLKRSCSAQYQEQPKGENDSQMVEQNLNIKRDMKMSLDLKYLYQQSQNNIDQNIIGDESNFQPIVQYIPPAVELDFNLCGVNEKPKIKPNNTVTDKGVKERVKSFNLTTNPSRYTKNIKIENRSQSYRFNSIRLDKISSDVKNLKENPKLITEFYNEQGKRLFVKIKKIKKNGVKGAENSNKSDKKFDKFIDWAIRESNQNYKINRGVNSKYMVSTYKLGNTNSSEVNQKEDRFTKTMNSLNFKKVSDATRPKSSSLGITQKQQYNTTSGRQGKYFAMKSRSGGDSRLNKTDQHFYRVSDKNRDDSPVGIGKLKFQQKIISRYNNQENQKLNTRQQELMSYKNDVFGMYRRSNHKQIIQKNHLGNNSDNYRIQGNCYIDKKLINKIK